MKNTKIKWHEKYNGTYHFAKKYKGKCSITAVISKSEKGFNLKFFDDNVVEIREEENFFNLELAKLYADCFMQGYFIC